MIGTDFHPGFKGVGPKRHRLIRKFGTLEEVAGYRGVEVPENIGEIETSSIIIKLLNRIHHHNLGHEEVLGMLKDELGFGDSRITKAIERHLLQTG